MLKCHMDRNHPDHGEKKHLCDFCGKGFVFEETCRAHKKNSHEKKIKLEQGKNNKSQQVNLTQQGSINLYFNIPYPRQ